MGNESKEPGFHGHARTTLRTRVAPWQWWYNFEASLPSAVDLGQMAGPDEG